MATGQPTHRFGIGDAVEVGLMNPVGNPRTPRYIRGSRGIVTVLHGRIVNPIDHHGVYPPLCSVLFKVRDVFGGSSADTLLIDLHEDWLEPAGSARVVSAECGISPERNEEAAG